MPAKGTNLPEKSAKHLLGKIQGVIRIVQEPEGDIIDSILVDSDKAIESRYISLLTPYDEIFFLLFIDCFFSCKQSPYPA